MEITQYLKDFIIQARKMPEIVVPETKKATEFQTHFRAPCQISVLWLNFNHHTHLKGIILTHNPRFEDLSIKIHGPLNVDSKQSCNHLEKFFSRKQLFSFAENDMEFEELRQKIIKKFSYLLFKGEYPGYPHPTSTGFVELGQIDPDTFFISAVKKVQAQKLSRQIQDISKFLTQEIDHEDFNRVRQPTPEDNRQYWIAWRLNFKNPSWIGERPVPDFTDQINGKDIREFIKCEISTKFRGLPFEIDSDGFCRLYLPNDGYHYLGEDKAAYINDINDLTKILLIHEYLLIQLLLDLH